MNPRRWSARTQLIAMGGAAVVVVAVVLALTLSGGSSNRPATASRPQPTVAAGSAPTSKSARAQRRRRHVLSPRAQAVRWIDSFGAAARRARARILALEHEVANTPTAYDPIAASAQSAQNALQSLSGQLSNQQPSSNSRLGGAENAFAAAANGLMNQMGDFIGFGRRNAHLSGSGHGQSARAGTHAHGGPPPEQPPSLQEQFKRQWNGAVRTIWRVARQVNPPTI